MRKKEICTLGVNVWLRFCWKTIRLLVPVFSTQTKVLLVYKRKEVNHAEEKTNVIAFRSLTRFSLKSSPGPYEP